MSIALQYADHRCRRWARWVLHRPEHGQFLPAQYLIAFLCAFVPLTPLMPRGNPIGPANPSGLELSAIAGATIVGPWLYWFLRCRRSIGVGWGVGLWTACVLITESHVVFFPSHNADPLYGAAAGLALFGALTTSYARHLHARFGWPSLGATDRYGVAVTSVLPLLSESVWEPHVRGVLAHVLASVLILPIMAVLTLNLVGACRMTIGRLERYMQTLGRQSSSWTTR